MKKLIHGILEFRDKVSKEYKETFTKLALGQSPDALLITCSDSRVAPNLFASTDPGDVFVLRNLGNLVPPCCHELGHSVGCESAPAALEFAILNLNVTSIIVCGHSECGAMQSIIQECKNVTSPHLLKWLELGKPALKKMNASILPHLAPHNALSQLNVLEQIEHLKTYPIIQERIKEKKLQIYGWWFDIAQTEVLSYNPIINKFVPFNNEEATRILESR